MADDTRALGDLLDRVDVALSQTPVSVQSVLDAVGEQSFAPVILIIAFVMVSPLSGIPGSSSIAALLIILVGVQGLIGRKHLWLPQFLLRRTIPGTKLRRAVNWLRKPANWFDRHSHRRWPILTIAPMRWATLASCVVLPMSWPFLEIFPFVTSFGAGAVSLLAFGLVTRDGLYVLLGFSVIAVLLGMGARLLGGV